MRKQTMTVVYSNGLHFHLVEFGIGFGGQTKKQRRKKTERGV